MSALEGFPRISTFLWFDTNAEEAVDFYMSIFPNSRRVDVLRNPGGAPGPLGGVMTVEFELDGQRFTALNGGPAHKFNEAVSLMVRCDTQDELDYYWEKLTDGGSPIVCGWLRDRFGLCWQIVPVRIAELLRHPKAMQAMMAMTKLDMNELERAGQEQ